MKEHHRLAYSIDEFMREAGIGSRSTVYKEINAGRLRTVKVGRRRIITHEAAREWLKSLEQEAA